MSNGKKYDDRIAIGRPPTPEDLRQLAASGYRTLVDVRNRSGQEGSPLPRIAQALGLRYVSIPIGRHKLRIEDLVQFYLAVYEANSAPLYVFSRLGRKPLAFMLLLEAVASGSPIQSIYRKASDFGLSLYADVDLQEFLIGLMNSGEVGPIYEVIRNLRPDLFRKPAKKSVPREPDGDRHMSLLCLK